jgi:hypothetical protein
LNFIQAKLIAGFLNMICIPVLSETKQNDK